MMKTSNPLVFKVILCIGLALGAGTMLYEGPAGACNADGSPFKVCSVGGYCVSCNAGAGANLIFMADCTGAGGTVIPGQDTCGY